MYVKLLCQLYMGVSILCLVQCVCMYCVLINVQGKGGGGVPYNNVCFVNTWYS